MNTLSTEPNERASSKSCASAQGLSCVPSAVDILILSAGTILLHNLPPALAAILNAMSPQDPTIKPRVAATIS